MSTSRLGRKPRAISTESRCSFRGCTHLISMTEHFFSLHSSSLFPLLWPSSISQSIIHTLALLVNYSVLICYRLHLSSASNTPLHQPYSLTITISLSHSPSDIPTAIPLSYSPTCSVRRLSVYIITIYIPSTYSPFELLSSLRLSVCPPCLSTCLHFALNSAKRPSSYYVLENALSKVCLKIRSCLLPITRQFLVVPLR